MDFEIMTTLNLPKTWPVSDAALYSEHLQLRHLAKSKKNYSQRNGDAGASCNGTYAPWCSKPHGVTEQFRPWRARAKSCGRLVGFAAGRRLLWCGFTTKTSHAETIGPRFNSADLSINVLIVFGCVWMIFGEELIHFLVDLPWFTTLIPICQLRSEAWLRNGPDGLGLLSHIE